MTHYKSRKPENVPWTEMPVANGNTRVNKRTRVVSRKPVIGLQPCKGLVVVHPDLGGGVAIEYHHQCSDEIFNSKTLQITVF